MCVGFVACYPQELLKQQVVPKYEKIDLITLIIYRIFTEPSHGYHIKHTPPRLPCALCA